MEEESLPKYVIRMRRHFHRHPELSFEEKSTLEFIKSELESIGLDVTEVPEGGLYADLHGKGDGITVALRADVDALPVKEEVPHEFRSENEGVMHACGHDAHIAMLLGVVRKAVKGKGSFNGTLRFLFQVAEERPPGGAVALIKAGALKGVSYVLGQHVLSTIPSGTVQTFPREAMANADEFRIKIHGKGGHGSAPHETSDVLVIAAQYVVMAQTIVSRMVDPFLPAVVTFGTFNSGFRYNIIAAHAELTGTVRTFDNEVREKIRDELEKLLDSICKNNGVKGEYEFISGYPAVVNTPSVTEVVDGVAEKILGKENVMHDNPNMGGEDFAFYLHEVPGSFYFLGVGNEEKGITSPQHSPTFDMDEDALADGVDILLGSAFELLKKS